MKTEDDPEEEPTHIPSMLTRDELLVFNTMFFIFSEADDISDVVGMMGAFERYADGRASLMAVLVEAADGGIQHCFTTPSDSEKH